jgi:hypothetical protein
MEQRKCVKQSRNECCIKNWPTYAVPSAPQCSRDGIEKPLSTVYKTGFLQAPLCYVSGVPSHSVNIIYFVGASAS